MANTSKYNSAQFCTWDTARSLVDRINADPNPIGGGVSPESESPELSGIYLLAWADPGDLPDPEYTDDVTGETYYPLLLRFQNGSAGHNVGLIIQGAKGHAAPCEKGQPPSIPNWKYALDHLRSEVDAWAASQG